MSRAIVMFGLTAACHAPAPGPSAPLVMSANAKDCIGPADRLDAGAWINWPLGGVVSDSQQRALPAITIDLLDGDRVVWHTTTDDSGRYVIGKLPSGTYTIKFSYGESVVRSESVEIGERARWNTSLDMEHVPEPRWCA